MSFSEAGSGAPAEGALGQLPAHARQAGSTSSTCSSGSGGSKGSRGPAGPSGPSEAALEEVGVAGRPVPGHGSRGAAASVSLQTEVSHLAREVERLSDAAEERAWHVRRQEGMLGQLHSSLGTLGKEVSASRRRVEDRLAHLAERAVVSGAAVEDLQARTQALHCGFTPGQRKALEARLAESREAMVQEVERMIHAELKELQERESARADKAKGEIHDLQAQLELFLSVESAATARCLSCSDRRAQLQNQTSVGSDGKVYQSQRLGTPSAGGPSVGGEKLPSVPIRGALKSGSKSQFLGGAGAPLHGMRTRAEDGSTKGLGRAASVGGLGSGDGRHNPIVPADFLVTA